MLTIVEPTVEDAAALSAMAITSFCDTFAFRDYPEADLKLFLDAAMSPEAYAKVIADPEHGLRIARNDAGAIIGFIKMGPNGIPMPEGEPPVERTRGLHQLYLLPEAKGTGLADDLTRWGMAWARARGAEALYLTVYIDNIRAQRFYARYGFFEIGKYPFAVGEVIDDDRIWKCPL